jgi:glycosyltransferase involved in cell wall biosynthesis
MRKIIFYIDSMQLGGANRVMANLVNHFSEKNIDVVLVNDIVPVEGKKEYGVNPSVRRVFLDQGDFTSVSRMKKVVTRIRKLRRLIKAEQPDVVISFMGPPNFRMLVATLGLRTKKIVSVRNDPNREYGTGITKHIARILFRLADGCVFQTREAAEYFPQCVQNKSKVIFNPVDERFYVQNLKNEEKEIIMVGRLQPQKNPELGIRAFAAISEKYPDYKLILYGEGELKDSLKEVAQRLSVDNRVVFYGQTSDTKEKMAKATIYLMTSDYEGMPNALMEAMAVGVPVISTDCPCGGPRAIIENVNQGILVRCRDEEQIASAIDKLLANEQLRATMRIAARKRAEMFHPHEIFKQWEEYLKKNIS